MNKAQLISILVIPMVNGSISFFASLTIIVCIFRSNLKLSTTYRRLIFGLSSFDIFQSLAQALSTVPMPQATMWAAAGNNISCGIQGFLTVVGVAGSMWYSLSLTIYFLMVIKYNLADNRIAKRYEPFLHGIPILYSVGIPIYIYVTQNLNPAYTNCWISYYPRGCENDPKVDCVNKGPIGPVALKWIISGFPFLFAFVLNTLLMVVIWWTVKSQINKSNAYRHSWIGSSPQASSNKNEKNNQDQDQQSTGICSKLTSCCSVCTKGANKEPAAAAATSPLAARLSRPSRASVQRLQRTKNRAIAYILGYLLSYLFSFIYQLMNIFGRTSPFGIVLIARFTFPLQGFFNVLIYTYPHVMSYRSRNPQVSWFRAFYEVIKSGGDSDDVRSSRATRRDSLKKQKKLLGERRQSLNGAAKSNNYVQRKGKETNPLKIDMKTTQLDTPLQSPCVGARLEVDVEIGYNQSSPLHINSKSTSSDRLGIDSELVPTMLNFEKEGRYSGESVASSLLPSHNVIIGSLSEFSNGGSSTKGSRVDDYENCSSRSYNPQKCHKEKEEEEEKCEIGADE